MRRTTAQRFGLHIDYAVWLLAMIGLGTVLVGGYRMAKFLIERLG